jgi:PAS domain S-box-containing protein
VEHWLIVAILIVLVAFIIIVVVHRFFSAMIKMNEQLTIKNEALSESEKNYREIFNSTTDAIFIHDLKGRILDSNKAASEMYGFTKEEFLMHDVLTMVEDSNEYTQKKAELLMRQAIQNGDTTFEWLTQNKSGHSFWIEVGLKRAFVMGDEHLVAVVRNVDDKKQDALELEKYRTKLEHIVQERTQELKEKNKDLMATNDTILLQHEELEHTLKQLKTTQIKLAESEKMASLGMLSSGIAHEINNPLNFINGGLMGLENHFEENPNQINEELKLFLNSIKEGISRASAIVASLNHFSRKDENNLENVSFHKLIDNCLVILNSRLKHKVLVNKYYFKDDLVFKGNEGRMHQALLNILSNSEQAIQDKGKIDIFTFKENGKFVVSIKDTGMGIEKEILSKITEPFFTTKDPGKGTGLGLSITYNIIQEHNGTLEFITEPGKGTQTIISIPQNI